VNSEPAKGTEFIFEIAFGLQHYDKNSTTLPLYISPGSQPFSFEGIKVLVVEDNQMNQLLIRHTFKGWQLEYELAENGQIALDWLKKEKFDLVLLDIQMPVMDGYHATQAIRDELKMDIPIIAMTAHALAGEREKCLSNGMNDYISKPIQERELHSLLEKYLSRRRLIIDTLKSTLHCIDFDFLFNLVLGNGVFLRNILTQFLKQFPGEMEQLKELVNTREKKQIAMQAHHIQSTVSVLGRNSPIFIQLEKLEKMALDSATPDMIITEFTALEQYKSLLMQDINLLMTANL